MSQSSPNILIVDDQEVNRFILAKGLEGRGFRTCEVEDGAAALERVAEGGVDAVLLDILMPRMSGLEVLLELRQSHQPSELPILMVTAFDDPEDISGALEAGANDYLTKPIDLNVTVARLNAAMTQKRAADALKQSNEHIADEVAARTRDLESINDELRREIAHRRQLETELREQKRAAEAASRAKSDFLATMSHELRTPLNSIIGFSDLIRMQLAQMPGTERMDEYAVYINDGGNHLLGIVNDILDLSKIDAGRTELNPAHMKVADLIDRSVRMTNANTSGHTIEVVLAEETQDQDLFCDEILMRRALVNMIGNALKFSEPETTVRISAAATPSGDLVFEIADQGIGIEEEDLPRIMEPFGQASSAFSRKHVGTGLGVPLTKSLVELHGGAFALESEPGVGTTIRLTLPADRLITRPDRTAVSVA